jgi:hypothetical protein
VAHAQVLTAVSSNDVDQAAIACKTANRLKSLLRTEEQRHSARMIKIVNQKLRGNTSINSVIVTNADNIPTQLFQKEQIESALLQETSQRFNQAAPTPFMQTPLAHLAGPTGNTQYVEDILSGTAVIPEDIDEYAHRLILHLRYPQNYDGITTVAELDVEMHKRGWQRARERTSAGPSRLHFGHFKAMATDEILAELSALMAFFPYKTGYSPERWRHGIQVMLMKQIGNINIDKLRAILLFEADFNFNNKMLGRQMMLRAEENNWIAPEQYGSWKRLSAIDHCVNKRISFDIMRQSKRPGVLCSNDAKGCYDRIIHSVATICMRRMGFPAEPILSMFTTLQNLTHYVRSSYGDSKSFFNAQEVNPIAIQGVGQGNGAGPQIWAVVSTAILNMLRETGNGAYLVSPISKEEFFFVGYAFVDDTDLLVTSMNNEDSAQTVTSMQHALNKWEGGLRATGGALEPRKTFWYLIDFAWTNGDWHYKKKSPRKLLVRNPEGIVQDLEQVSVSEARRTLGVRLAPDGSNKEEFDHLLTIAKTWAENIRTGKLARKYVWQSLNSTVMAQLSHPLPATTFSREESFIIDAIIHRAALPAEGINRNFPLAMCYGSEKKQGFGMVTLYDKQGAEWIARIIRYAEQKDHFIGKLLRISYEYMEIEAGIDRPIFMAEYSEYAHLVTDCLLKATWEYASHNRIEIMTPVSITLQRTNDQFIIPALTSHVSTTEPQRINKCRLYLQAITLADIVSGDGSKIQDDDGSGRRLVHGKGGRFKEIPAKKTGTSGTRLCTWYLAGTTQQEP